MNPASRSNFPWLKAVAVSLAIVAVSIFLASRLFSVPAVPRVGFETRAAHSAATDSRFVSDGQRLFFVMSDGLRSHLAQAPAGGGQAVEIPTPFEAPAVFDISHDGAQLLLGADSRKETRELWSLPAAGGAPRRLGSISARDAAWSANGRRLVYTSGASLFTANADGSGAARIATLPGDYLAWPGFSADGNRIRVSSFQGSNAAILEVNADGSNPHRWLPDWSPVGYCCGSWIDHGRYYVFEARSDAAETDQIWIMPESAGPLGFTPKQPLRLTTGPRRLIHPGGSRNGKRIFALNSAAPGEAPGEVSALDLELP